MANVGIAALCAVLSVAILTLTFAPKLLAYEAHVIRGRSLEPFIPAGSLAIVQPVRAADLRVGDVITYRPPEDPGAVTARRIVDVRIPADRPGAHRLFKLAGGAGNGGETREVDLYGTALRQVATVPLLGYVLGFGQGPLGQVLFLFAPSAALAYIWSERAWRRLREAPQPA